VVRLVTWHVAEVENVKSLRHTDSHRDGQTKTLDLFGSEKIG